ncbi:hypothetical protein OIU74_023498 [Salix koriyanagi]|uniref:Uncharacterized protein n=1 Tax=Salix koriyanagi TaxID=2511006 RepID=A0A9Q0WFD5_9ROSI|nr:hypothetical protein OIU74_023498 [Salix koriyanagi]
MKYRKQQIATPGHSNRGASTSYGAVTNATGTCLRKGTTTGSLPKGKYEIIFKLQVKQGAFGLYDSPIFMMAKVGKREDTNGEKSNYHKSQTTVQFPQNRFKLKLMKLKMKTSSILVCMKCGMGNGREVC